MNHSQNFRESCGFKKLVISGGGMKGIASLGAAHYYSEKGYLKDIEEYAGCSIGSAIIVLLAIGYEPMEIFTRIYTQKNVFTTKYAKENRGSLWGFGMLSIRPFIDFIEEMILEKCKEIPTMSQLLYTYGKYVVISVTNESKMCGEYITPNTKPDLKCTAAVEMSCNLPIIFKRIEYEGCGYVDGALTDACPVKKIDDKSSKILCLVTQGVHNEDGISNEFARYLYNLIAIPIEQNLMLRIEGLGGNVTLIRMLVPSTGMLNFDMASTEKMNVFMHGYYSSRKENTTSPHYESIDTPVSPALEYCIDEGWEEVNFDAWN